MQYGASTDAKIRDGRSIRELLLDESYWRNPEETIRQFSKGDEALLKLSENLTITPREYVARHRGIMIWGFHRASVESDDLFEWSQEVVRLLNSPEDLEAAYRQYLDEETLNRELKAIERSKLRHQRDIQRKEGRAAYIAEFYPGDPLFD